MLSQPDSVVSTALEPRQRYTTPHLTWFGTVTDVTSASAPPVGGKGGNAIESNVGIGQGDVRRP